MCAKVHKFISRTKMLIYGNHQIAEAAKRDSTAMMALAALGALFFPGSFMAVSRYPTPHLKRARAV